ncbi:MAG: acyl-CoA dehydrogenase family protein [Proteobacteria bacterium]|nr:acyl-CoA dehydrogenase family protein [Pseudomonadota bacterium]
MTLNDEMLLKAARQWSEELPARSDEIETARRLPADISQAFASAGFYHALVPREFGGIEAHPHSLVDMIREIARGDGSAGWNVMIGATTGLLAASLREDLAAEIYGQSPGVMTVGVTAPLGRAEKLDGGCRVTGRWPFGSGSQNADWICGGTFVYQGDERVPGRKGPPDIHLMMFEKSQVEIEDTWRVSGLRGTGSHHFHVDDQWVPEGRWVVMGERARIERPLYQFPMLGLLALGVSSVSLGIGEKALRAFKELAVGKTPTGSSRSLANRSQIQALTAASVADLESARSFIHMVIDEAYREAEKGNRLSQAIKARLRLAAANATHRSVAAVDRLYKAGGGSSIYDESDLQRCFRDIHVTTQHIMVASPVFEAIGRVELGMEAGSPL